MSFGMEFKEFNKRIDLLSLAKSQVKKIASDLKAKEVRTSSSTALNTEFYILFKKGDYSWRDKKITIDIEWNRFISIHTENMDISGYLFKQMKPTQTNILRLSIEVKKLLKGVKK